MTEDEFLTLNEKYRFPVTDFLEWDDLNKDILCREYLMVMDADRKSDILHDALSEMNDSNPFCVNFINDYKNEVYSYIEDEIRDMVEIAFKLYDAEDV